MLLSIGFVRVVYGVKSIVMKLTGVVSGYKQYTNTYVFIIPANLVKNRQNRLVILNQQAKQVKARNKLQTAQTNLLKASSPLRTN